MIMEKSRRTKTFAVWLHFIGDYFMRARIALFKRLFCLVHLA